MTTRRAAQPASALRLGVVAVGLAVALGACSGGGVPSVDSDQSKPFVLEGVTGVTEVAQLTGPGAMNDTELVAVAGTDLGSMVNLGDRTYFLFGDTFGERDPDSIGGQGGNWRSNVAAYSTDSDPSDGITFDGWAPVDGIGIAAAMIEGDHDPNTGDGEVTKIPTGGFAIGDDLYVQYMSVNYWGDAGVWNANYAGIAKSSDQGETWAPVEGVRWPGDSNFVQITAARVTEGGEDYLYLWGIPSGRFGGVQLMRVPAATEAVEDLNSYSYFAGVDASEVPQWSSNPGDADEIVQPTVGELSVMWSDYLDRWIMTYSDAGNAYIREGITPWGPWGDAIELVSGVEYPGLYSPYLNPRYVTDGGKRIYFTLSIWGPYNVYWFSADLTKTAS